MRSIIIVLCIFVFAENSFAQNSKPISSKELIGVWQINTPQEADAWGKCFVFYKNGKYILHYSQYDDIARIKSVQGRYTLRDSSFSLTIESRTEISGGTLVPGSMGFQREEFVLDGGNPIVIKQAKEEPISFYFKNCKGKNGARCIEINNNKYYKISSDPNKYTD